MMQQRWHHRTPLGPSIAVARMRRERAVARGILRLYAVQGIPIPMLALAIRRLIPRKRTPFHVR